MKIYFLFSDVNINGTIYRAKTKNIANNDANGELLNIEFKTFTKTKYDTFDVASLEEFSTIAPGIFANPESWGVEPDALPN